MAGSIAAVVRAVAFVPGSPLLVPGLGGAADVLADLRATCLEAVRALGDGPVAVLAAAPHPGTYGAADVGAWLVGAAGGDVGAVLTPENDPVTVADGLPLLVVADGSARRGPQAPLGDDPGAEAWDDALAAALGRGDLDVDLTAGRPLGSPVSVWRAARALADGRSWDARLLHHGAPLGVAYLVATWL